jgi:ankyrin repeat protein
MAPQDQAFAAAAAAGNLELMLRLLFPNDPKRRSARKDFMDERGCSALSLATRNGRHDAVKWLVKVCTFQCKHAVEGFYVSFLSGGVQC